MGNLLNWLSNNGQFVVILLFFAISAFGGVARWLQEQAAKKRAEAERRRKIETQLRTGRSEPESPSPSQRAPQGEDSENFAERRRRQIEEMRRRQEAAQRERDAVRQRQTSHQTSQTSRRPDRRRTADPQSSGPIATAAGVQVEVREPTPEQEDLAARFERRARAARAAAQGKAGAILPVQRASRSLDRATLRRAVVLAEVLAPPVALRAEGQRPV